MNKENVVHRQRVLFRHKEKQNYAIFRKIDGTGRSTC
jgi:hypothetical protein